LPGGLEATFAGGRQLQHGLYALAAAELLRHLDAHPRVVGSYYFPTSRGRRTRVIRPATSPRPVADVLRDLFDVIAAGAFVHTSKDDDCRFCDFDSACGGQSTERVARKLANAGNAVLDPYRRLAAHE
jgi:ATP-dependent helicase/nuclease subunit B